MSASRRSRALAATLALFALAGCTDDGDEPAKESDVDRTSTTRAPRTPAPPANLPSPEGGRGETLTINGAGCVKPGTSTPGREVRVLFIYASIEDETVTPFGPFEVGAAGNWKAAFPVPANAKAGRYDVVARCLGETDEPMFDYAPSTFTVVE